MLVGPIAARSVINRRIGFIQNVVIVGAGDVGQLVANKMIGRPGSRLNLVGFVDDDPSCLHPESRTWRCSGRRSTCRH